MEPNETANIQSFMNRKSHSNFFVTFEIDTFYTKKGERIQNILFFEKRKTSKRIFESQSMLTKTYTDLISYNHPVDVLLLGVHRFGSKSKRLNNLGK